MEVGPVLVFLFSPRNETIGWRLEGLKKMIRLRVFGIAAKIPKIMAVDICECAGCADFTE